MQDGTRYFTCRWCGVNKLKKYYNAKLRVCNTCAKEYPELQEKRRKIYESPVYVSVREVENYNKEHGTSYTYGQYVSMKDGGRL